MTSSLKTYKMFSASRTFALAITVLVLLDFLAAYFFHCLLFPQHRKNHFNESGSIFEPVGSTEHEGSIQFPSNEAQVHHIFTQVSEGCVYPFKYEGDGLMTQMTQITAFESFYNYSDYSNLESWLVQRYKDAPFLRTEAALIASSSHQQHYHRIPSFDDDGQHVTWQHEALKGGVALFHNAFVDDERFLIFNCEVIYFPGGCRANHTQKSAFKIKSTIGRLRAHYEKKLSIQQYTHAVAIGQFWGTGFYHFLVEDITRLGIVLQYLRTHPNVTILGPQGSDAPIYHALYRVLGLDPARIVPKPSGPVFVEQLLVPVATRCGVATPRAVKELQRTLHANIPYVFQRELTDFDTKEDPKGLQLVVVVQARAPNVPRSLVNHQKLLTALREALALTAVVVEYGAHETMTAAIVKHYRAQVVIGPHGAGLSNLIFSQRGATLVEIHPRHYNAGKEANLCHQETARAAGANAHLLVEDNGTVETPFTTNVTRVVHLVQHLVNKKRKLLSREIRKWKF